jgi:hypothetical protein
MNFFILFIYFIIPCTSKLIKTVVTFLDCREMHKYVITKYSEVMTIEIMHNIFLTYTLYEIIIIC